MVTGYDTGVAVERAVDGLSAVDRGGRLMAARVAGGNGDRGQRFTATGQRSGVVVPLWCFVVSF